MTWIKLSVIISIMIEITKYTESTKLTAMFKALANENRLAIFNLVRQGVGDCCQLTADGNACSCVCDIGEQMNLALSTVSHHLKELRNAELIVCEKRGQWVYCSINPKALDQIEVFLKA